MGTNFWWLDDEPKWVARILYEHSAKVWEATRQTTVQPPPRALPPRALRPVKVFVCGNLRFLGCVVASAPSASPLSEA